MITKEEAVEIKRRWIELLRSGKYTQIFGNLKGKDEDCRCANGVLCDVLIERYPQKYSWKGRYFVTPENQGGFVCVMPSEIGYCLTYLTQIAVVENDQERLPFASIADKLEETECQS